MKRTAALAALLVLALAPPALAVDEGVPDRDRHPNGGLLAVDFDGAGPEAPTFWCGGSVLSDRHFLTAAHCVTVVPPEAEFVVALEPGSPAAPVYRPSIIDEFPIPLAVPGLRGAVATVHPRFDPESLAHDVAVLELPPGSFEHVAPIALPRLGRLDHARPGRRLRLVGYGVDPERGDDPFAFTLEGYRQTRTARLTGLTRGQLEFDEGLCVADSGSPQFLGDSNVAVSLFVDHPADCTSGRFSGQRLDTRAERRFLAPFVEES